MPRAVLPIARRLPLHAVQIIFDTWNQQGSCAVWMEDLTLR